MKKNLLLLVISGASVCAFAQPTWDFDTPSPAWNGTGPNEQPNGWVTGNVIVGGFFPGNTQSVFKAVAPDVHGGLYAMQIVTVDVVTNPDATLIPDPIGFAITGSVVVVPALSLKFGFGYSARPASAEFWYKYAPSGTDTASFFMWLTKWNTVTVTRDTVAWGYWETSATVSSYTQQSVTLTYLSSTLSPDTAGVIFSATGTGCMTCGNVGSTMWVDDVTFSGWNGINEHPSSNGVIMFPNPASEFVTISLDADDAANVIAYDATGRRVAAASLSEPINSINKKAGVINTSNLTAGIYSYSVMDKNGNTLRAGKFSVVR